MINKGRIAAVVVMALAVAGCGYIVTPADENTAAPASDHGWGAVVTGVTESSGTLHVDLAIRNDTNDWSALSAATSGSARVTSGGKASDCATAYVGTGGASLAPGFISRGYTGGSKTKPVTQLLYVECAGVAKGTGMSLAIDYSYVTGPFNYYQPSKQVKATFDLKLDQVSSDMKYPVAEKVDKLIESPSVKIPAINNCTVQLTATTRTPTGLEFTWEITNPSDYPAYVHIGTPPVIGSDGVIYGFYESPHLADTPITPSGGKATWKTTVAVPAEVTGLYLMPSIESQQQKFFVNHAVDITDK